MNLGGLIAEETGASLEEILLLRHSNRRIKKLEELGGSIEEYSIVQPAGTIYDYLNPEKPLIRFVVVIVFDKVYAVYEILVGIDREGTTRDIASETLRLFYATLDFEENDFEQTRLERLGRKFKVKPVQSSTVGKAVRGWTAPRSAVARFGGRHFASVEVDGL